MENCLKFYIGGQWVDPVDPKPFDVINPANEQVIGQIMMGNEEDLNKAVAAAKKAFPSFSRTSVQERLELMDAIMAAYQFQALLHAGAPGIDGCDYGRLSKPLWGNCRDHLR